MTVSEVTDSLAFCPMDTAPKDVAVILVSAWGQKAVAIWDDNCWRYGPNPGDTWEADYPHAWVPVHACGWITTSARSASEAPWAEAVSSMVKRARSYLAMNAAESGADVLIDELASLLIALDAERGRMREALKPFAKAADEIDAKAFCSWEDQDHLPLPQQMTTPLIVGDLRRARSALPAVTTDTKTP